MLKHSFEFDTGMKIEISEDGFKLTFSLGEEVEFDKYGNRKVDGSMASAKANFGDYFELPSSRRFWAVSMMESGYSEEQRFDIEELNRWRVIFSDEKSVVLVSAKSAGKLKLSGLIGYENCAGILSDIAMAYGACDEEWCNSSALGMSADDEWRIEIEDITKVRKSVPYSSLEAKNGIVDAFTRLGIKTDSGIWLASRNLHIINGGYYFGVNCLRNNGTIIHEVLNKSYIAGSGYSKTVCCDVFPIVHISGYSVVFGRGTEDCPYKVMQ